MANVTAKFGADFSDFNSKTAGAATQLRDLEGAAGRAGASLKQIGGSATATTFGQMGTAATQTTSSMTQMANSLGAVDKTLAVMGVHIGPEVQALKELGQMAAMTTFALGPLEIAALAVGAAFLVWRNIDTAKGYLKSLQDQVASSTSGLMGWGDAAAETAAAKTDVLNRATAILQKQTGDATREVKDFTQAQKIIADELRDRFGPILESTQHLLSVWQGEIRKLRESGTLPQLTEDLKSHRFTLEELSTAYGISVRALQEYSTQLDATDKRQQAAGETLRKTTEEAKKFADAKQQDADKWVAEQTGMDKFAKAVDDVTKAQQAHLNVSAMDLEHAQALNKELTDGIAIAQQQTDVNEPLLQQMRDLAAATAARVTQLQAEKDALAASIEEAKKLTDQYLAEEKAAMGLSAAEAYLASGGTNAAGFAAGFVPIGQSAMKPSVFSAGGIAGVNLPGSPTGASTIAIPVSTIANPASTIANPASTIANPASTIAPPVTGVTFNNTFNVNSGSAQALARELGPIIRSQWAGDLMVGTQYALTRTG